MFLHRGLHFAKLSDMIGFALIDDIYVMASEEYKTLCRTGKFTCSNEQSVDLIFKYYTEFYEYKSLA